jgi:parallel beta-helix repeat protein
VTFKTYPGDAAATVASRWVIKNGANFVTIENLKLDMSALPESVGLVITGDDFTLRNTDVSAGGVRRICVAPNADAGAIPDRFLIDGNRIHHCGPPPKTLTGQPGNNETHGLYVAYGNGTVRNNVVYDNHDRGIQLYPSANNVAVQNNTLDGNGEGVNFGEETSNSAVTNNVIANSKTRWNIEQNALTGTGNSAIGNCVFASNADAYYNGDGGLAIADGLADVVNLGTGNPIQNPNYVNAAAKDFRVQNSACSGKGAPDSVEQPTGFPAT